MAKPRGKGWVLLGVAGVDSGLLMIADPCYVIGEDASDKYSSWAQFMRKHGILEPDMDEVQAKQLNYQAGHAGLGVCFRSGCGDGEYEVWGRFDDIPGFGRRIVEVRVLM